MTGEWLFYIIVFVLMAVAVVATVLVGMSRSNREGNPDYFKKTDRKMTRLTMYYVICFGAAILALGIYVYNL
ncbi:hypothetical protein [Paenibacillus hexagrammi]|uniref:Group-specific protein n=1 Tax=Paenibacillus hexagrammi TaxID=2908839 RepID=A0ABY3SJS6_9BACL|nr:hypothetical protein [Paenibacillus sp. YPD9-1]UJF33964.1 hypothetical protein L0M14_01580 [Paenibacillus sp. YPD9-1]